MVTLTAAHKIVPLSRLSLAICTLVTVACSPANHSVSPELQSRVHRIALQKDYQASDYAFLKSAVGDRSIVQLGESIHITQEFPRARLRLVQYLHEEMGFDVLAFEGSLIDTWLAQDYIYRSKEPADQTVRKAVKLAFFGLWQTDPMSEVMAYVIKTQSSPNPLYLSDFDIQPGMARTYRGEAAAFGAFLKALRAYDPTKSSDELAGWGKALSPVLACKAAASPDLPILAVEEWIQQVAVKVQSQRPEIHAKALRLATDYLRARIQHCQEVRDAPGSRNTYQIVRDRLNADNALALRDRVSKSHKIMLWAHHSHVNHNATGQNIPSMGQHLMALAPNALYTVGLFAGRGSAFDAITLDHPGALGLGLLPRTIHSQQDYGVEGSLARVAHYDFFVDLAAPGKLPQEWTTSSFSRAETNKKMPTILAKDYHAAIFIQQVHPADLLLFPVWLNVVLRVGGVMLDHVFVFLAMAAMSIVVTVRWLVRRRRRRPGVT